MGVGIVSLDMTADEFVAALRRVADENPLLGESHGWGTITRRLVPLFEHPSDPVLDLLARYDVSGVTFWQLAFADGTAPCFDGLWHVASKTTDAYYVEDGQLLHMYYKADYPSATGLTSSQFLDVMVVYARMIVAVQQSPSGPHDSVFDEYASQAAAVTPHATGLDWFWESRRR